MPENNVINDSLSWLDKFGNKEVDQYCDWLIISNFQVVTDLKKDSLIVENNELGKIQILKAQGYKCDRCWHYQQITFQGIQNTRLCKRCSNVININSN